MLIKLFNKPWIKKKIVFVFLVVFAIRLFKNGGKGWIVKNVTHRFPCFWRYSDNGFRIQDNEGSKVCKDHVLVISYLFIFLKPFKIKLWPLCILNMLKHDIVCQLRNQHMKQTLKNQFCVFTWIIFY